MKIVVAHNHYQDRGGEESVVAEEIAMLRRNGHSVEEFSVGNDEITSRGAKVVTAVRSFYSEVAYRKIAKILSIFRPDVLHVHNFFPTMSPSIYFAANRAGIPVVQTLHNYRLICANAKLFRNGHPCEDCLVTRSFLPGIEHACYRESRIGSAVVGAVTSLHTSLGTWEHRISRYITLSHFAAQKLGEQRIPRQRIRVKANFVRDLGCGRGDGGFALYVGRLSSEKGLETIIAADAIGLLPMPLYIAGDGPLLNQVQQACGRPNSRLVYLGHKPRPEIMTLMKKAAVLVVPSMWYEGFPMVMAEALSFGLPIIASRIGSLPEIVEDGVSGYLVEPKSARSLLRALEVFSVGTQQALSMRRAARTAFETRYTEEKNIGVLTDIYQEAICVTGFRDS